VTTSEPRRRCGSLPCPSALAACLLAAGCATASSAPWADQRLCRAEKIWRAEVSPQGWLETLLKGFDLQTRRATSPALDCAGEQVTWPGAGLGCVDNALARTELPQRELGDGDVVASQVGPELWLVWITTTRYASGEAMGPVALVDSAGREVVVRVKGALRAFPTRARLRLEQAGGSQWLVAEGERCAPDAPTSCERAARLMRLQGERFLPETFATAEGRCVSPGVVHLLRREGETLPNGWRRTKELTAQLTFEPAGLRVQELLTIRDADPRQPQTPPRLFRRADGDWSVSFQGARAVASAASVWDRMSQY
jgi:hypothetical protein